MSALFRQNPIAFVLAAAATVLIAVIALEAAFGLWPSAPASNAKPVPAAEIKLLPPLAAVVPDQAYPETASRPLFTPTRRPAPAAPTVAGNMVKGQFTLTGVIAVGDLRIALLREKTGGKMHRVERGKEVNGMTLASVENDKVTLAQGGDEEVLTLQVQKGPTQAAAAAPAAAGPFGPFAPSGSAGQPIPGMPTPAGVPQPGQPGGQAAPGTAPRTVAQPAPPPATNPAQRSNFGPFPNQPAANSSEAATTAAPMTPEELLARRRARRGQQQPNQ